MLPAWSGDDIRAILSAWPCLAVWMADACICGTRSICIRWSARLCCTITFLYDWHDWDDGAHRLHGFTHGQAALRNAVRDFRLNAIERDSIACHMFPMTLKPPSYIEGYLVTMADKISATRETFSLERFSKPQLESGKPLAAIESGASAASAHDGRHKPSRSREVLA